ncbi:metallo-beta-lactamase superfamily [Fusarium mundagurra]|uniref:Metallo-beta-lactamase superfamily n=1 Tax=Fusarium mundagurra TaxID=1567541 RepID=A0A8H5YAL3_9HYPO|nr:metallo-beta-lactamase superfamily [Fusarium mundagurra]
MSPIRLPPPVVIPQSQSIVDVYIIDTTSYMSNVPASSFVEPLVSGFETLNAGSYAFLIKHTSSKPSKHDTMVFDLGVRKDWENLPDTFVASVKEEGWSIDVQTDVASILRENGQDLNSVGAIIWSHWHFDHVGDPQTFPSTTDLIVGPGFKQAVMPGWPTAKDSHVNEAAWQGRELIEIDFSGEAALDIGKFQAYDFYGDGSFYLLNSPGHAVGHMSALARTTADPPSFILLGGDIAHHCGEFRPSPYTPLPEMISPNPLGHTLSACPGRLFLSIHPCKDPERPFFDPTVGPGWHDEGVLAKESIDKLIEADAYDNIFPVMAHDMTLVGTIDLFPEKANNWMSRRWKEDTRWGFCGDFTPLDEDIGADVVNSAAPEVHHEVRDSVQDPKVAAVEYTDIDKKVSLTLT